LTTARYLASDDGGAFRLGEVLGGVHELRFDTSQISPFSYVRNNPRSQRVFHPWSIVLTPDCDLDWDFKSRQSPGYSNNKLVTHVLLCDLEDQFALESDKRITRQRDFERAKTYREERYHYLPISSVESGMATPEYFLDFKRLFSVPLDSVYESEKHGLVHRNGYLRPPWIQHLTHRFTFFLGRVGLPDEE